jgi:hypothetical protein
MPHNMERYVFKCTAGENCAYLRMNQSIDKFHHENPMGSHYRVKMNDGHRECDYEGDYHVPGGCGVDIELELFPGGGPKDNIVIENGVQTSPDQQQSVL